jgi:hypothetical protein
MSYSYFLEGFDFVFREFLEGFFAGFDERVVGLRFFVEPGDCLVVRFVARFFGALAGSSASGAGDIKGSSEPEHWLVVGD